MTGVISDPIVRLAEIEIDPDRLQDYTAALAEEIEASVEGEAGVLMLSAVSERDHPHRIRILEVYADEEAYRTHLLSPHFLKYKTTTAGMVRSLRLVPADPILLRVRGGDGLAIGEAACARNVRERP